MERRLLIIINRGVGFVEELLLVCALIVISITCVIQKVEECVLLIILACVMLMISVAFLNVVFKFHHNYVVYCIVSYNVYDYGIMKKFASWFFCCFGNFHGHHHANFV